MTTAELFPLLQPRPLLRCYRHIVGEKVWAKVVAYKGYISPLFLESFKYFDYATGSAIEGNLVHWIANRKKGSL